MGPGFESQRDHKALVFQSFFCMFYTYILYSEKLNKFYIGSTENVEKRLAQHNNGNVKFTSRGIPWILKYTETYQDRTTAMKREYEIKGKKSRKYIEWIITTNK
jgi:putative endonuclease